MMRFCVDVSSSAASVSAVAPVAGAEGAGDAGAGVPVRSSAAWAAVR